MTYQTQSRRLMIEVYDDAGLINRGLEILGAYGASNSDRERAEDAADRAEAAEAAVAIAAADSAGTATTQAGIATTKAGEASTSAANAATSAGTATTQAGIATTKAGEAAASALAASESADEILNLTAAATTLSPGASATASYNAGTGVMTFGIPEGQPGTGTGDVKGPASAVADRIAVFNGTTGKLLKDGGSTVALLAPKASPAFTGTPTAPTAAPGTNTTQIATTAFVLANALSGRNLIINGTGRINQRGYVSGTATSGANQFTLDRWFVVTSGQNLSFTGNDSGRVMTAPAGGVSQVIEGANIVGGTYVLNWTGTATCTVNGTARTKGASFTLNANSNATVKFTGGTFSEVQLEAGTIATPFERVDIGAELARCQRYFEIITVATRLSNQIASDFIYTTGYYVVQKRGVPTTATLSDLDFNTTSRMVTPTSSRITCSANVSATGVVVIERVLAADSEITA